MAKNSDLVTGRWPVAVRDHEGKRVEPGNPAKVSREKASEFDARFGRQSDEPSGVSATLKPAEPAS